MTNEEAIETLKTNYPDACFEQLREAVDMAIEALKEQPEPTLEQIEEYCHKRRLSIVDNALLRKYAQAESDLISRQAAIDVILADKIDDTGLKIMTALGDGRLALTLNDACDRHIRDIEKLPPGGQKRK